MQNEEKPHLKPKIMRAIAILDRLVLEEITKEGSLTKKLYNTANEIKKREFFYHIVDTEYSKAIKSANTGIVEKAKASKTNYFIPILQTELEESYWKHIHRFDDGRLYFDSVHERQYPKLSTMQKVFEKGIIHKDDEVRNFNEWELKMKIAWAVARKLAKTFLQQHLEVELLETDIHITLEYQNQLDYKTSRVTMHFLRVSWG